MVKKVPHNLRTHSTWKAQLAVANFQIGPKWQRSSNPSRSRVWRNYSITKWKISQSSQGFLVCTIIGQILVTTQVARYKWTLNEGMMAGIHKSQQMQDYVILVSWELLLYLKEPSKLGASGSTAVILAIQGGRDLEDHNSKPAWANSSWDPILIIPNTKRAGGVARGVGPEFKP
jgi:hypothetical protein